MKPPARFDISLILNANNETGYFRRTMMSLEEATSYVRSCGLKVELVVVLDRPPPAAKAWFEEYDFGAFDSWQVSVVDNGSLGLSRNDGIRLARGEYIGLCDADDLISFNFYAEHYFTCREKGRKTIVVPQYTSAFGTHFELREYVGTDCISKMAFFGHHHPYSSRIFAHRSLFDEIEFVKVGLTAGFAYEDWHFNCEAISYGCEFAVARDTVLFYRQRPNSLRHAADNKSSRRIPFSRFFDPSTFLKVCAADYARFSNSGSMPPSAFGIRRGFFENPKCIELTHRASEIDPGIELCRVEHGAISTNTGCEINSGALYYRLSQFVAGRTFSDVVLLPHLGRGGAEKYILGVLDGIKKLCPNASFLVLAGEPGEGHAWVDRLPEGTLFIDLYRACSGCDEEMLHTITMRLIQATAPSARVHIKSSLYASGYFARYGRLLPGNFYIYYRFMDSMVRKNDLWFHGAFEFDFLSSHGEHLDLVLTDNAVLAARDGARLDTLKHKLRVLYARCDVPPDAPPPIEAPFSGRLLWASRLVHQKRPYLLPALARRLEEVLPEARIDVFGNSVAGDFDATRLDGLRNLTLHGAFSNFDSLRPGQYDALLYTSETDGLPNVVLEALAAGLPVIAPNVGGISEAVTERTGFLIDNDPDDDRLIGGYVQAVLQLSQMGGRSAAMRRAGVELISTRHSEEVFLARLADVFDLALRKPVCVAAE